MTYLVVDAMRERTRADWRWLPLRRVARLRRERNVGSRATLLALGSEDGVRPRPDDGGRQLPSEATIEDYWLVRRNDLVFNPMWAIGRGVAVSNVAGAVSTAYRVYEPGPVLHPRYLHHYMRSDPVVEQYSLVVRGLTTFDRSVTRDDLDALPIPLPPLPEQRAIAGFLDAETARIDALITKKHRLIELLDDWEQRTLLDALGDWREGRSRSLRQYGTSVLTGPFGTVLSAEEYVQGGVPLINPTHIVRGKLVHEPHVSVTESVARRIGRHRLRVGDIVMGRKGDVGRSAVVPPESDGWLCGSDSIAIRCNRSLLEPRFLATALHVGVYRQQLVKHSTGATLANVNEPTLLALRLPDCALVDQHAALDWAARRRSDRDGVVGRLGRQIDLLVEHRQALITAAVTGELSVPGVAA